VDRVVGLDGVRVEFAMVQTPDGNGRLELVKFHSPSAQGGDRDAPANTLDHARSHWALRKGAHPVAHPLVHPPERHSQASTA
jgi:hypothetical protein